MKVKDANSQIKQKNHYIRRAAKAGAILTSGSIGATQAYNWVKNPQMMKDIVKLHGGTVPYAKNFVIATALFSTVGAVFSAIVAKIANHIEPKKPPKAAN